MGGCRAMNSKIIKWGKRAVTTACLGIVGLLLYALSYYVYWNWYIPYHTDSLYQEAMQNPNKAEEIAQQFFDMEDHTCNSSNRALELITYYAKKGRIGSQKMLEQYNADEGLPIESKAPINRYIFGIDLGKSTKQDVWDYLDSKSLNHQELENGSITQCYSDFEFAGIYWGYVYFYYVNNKVYKILFSCKSKRSNIKEIYVKLRNILAEKYTLIKQLDSNYRKELIDIRDLKTSIILEISGYKELTCKYTDLSLEKEKNNQNLNDI